MSLNSLPYSVVKVDDPSRSGKTLGVSFRRHESGPFSDNTGNGFPCLGLGEERRKKKTLSVLFYSSTATDFDHCVSVSGQIHDWTANGSSLERR